MVAPVHWPASKRSERYWGGSSPIPLMHYQRDMMPNPLISLDMCNVGKHGGSAHSLAGLVILVTRLPHFYSRLRVGALFHAIPNHHPRNCAPQYETPPYAN